MSDLGADVVKVKGNYEKSLMECIKQSTENNWQIVQDVAWKDYMVVPKYTMAGYTVMMKEIANQIQEEKITHIILQAGVGGMAASMIAYLSAQFIDVRLFHFWKNLTNGKHLWLRNNASTIGSQLVDTTLVICVLFIGAEGWGTEKIVQAIIDGWTFKMLCALIDTPIFYICTHFLKRKFNLKINEEVSL